MTLIRILVVALIGTVVAALVRSFLPESVRPWGGPLVALLVSLGLSLLWHRRAQRRQAVQAMSDRVAQRLREIQADLHVARTRPGAQGTVIVAALQAERVAVQRQADQVLLGQVRPQAVPGPRPTIAWLPEPVHHTPASAGGQASRATPRGGAAPRTSRPAHTSETSTSTEPFFLPAASLDSVPESVPAPVEDRPSTSTPDTPSSGGSDSGGSGSSDSGSASSDGGGW
ncbi:hypothetical protein [Deinococcus multiflagellatus]|uniref:hypothetical protein n=1 Tax=Deinococcus multiflagellatus TaxID=1656887 RepID=UPI001CCEA6AE|nr:hypothetical protein [Deinococcus multiflagellatus]MBZ9715305.1 hypothetical protein [Deinococcus multiflagellatus]